MLVGWGGNNGTTLTAGVIANRGLVSFSCSLQLLVLFCKEFSELIFVVGNGFLVGVFPGQLRTKSSGPITSAPSPRPPLFEWGLSMGKKSMPHSRPSSQWYSYFILSHQPFSMLAPLSHPLIHARHALNFCTHNSHKTVCSDNETSKCQGIVGEKKSNV